MIETAGARDDRIVVTAGHWTDPVARTGCTVVLFDRPAAAAVDVRGGAPGTRETALLGAGDLVQTVDAILLTGGSAFGLEAAGGVMAYLKERGRGVPTSAGPVPIVPAAVIYDLGVGTASWPTAADALKACIAAGPLESLPRGMVGVGTGATTRKAFPGLSPERGGLGTATVAVGSDGSVTAIVAVNAVGQVVLSPDAPDHRPALLRDTRPMERGTATTVAVVVVDAEVDHRTLSRCTIAAHDAFARMIRPCHTIHDGDVVFAVGLATGAVAAASILAYGTAVEIAVERAIIDAVTA